MDIDTHDIGHLIELAGQTVSTAEKSTSLVKSLAGFFKAPQTPDELEAKAAIILLTTEMLNAKEANTKIRKELIELRDAKLKASRFDRQFERYSLWETPGGMMVYRLDEAKAEGDPIHCICPDCAEQQKRSILQGGDEIKVCYQCKSAFRIAAPEPHKPAKPYLVNGKPWTL